MASTAAQRAFARIVSVSRGIYRCPNCTRLGTAVRVCFAANSTRQSLYGLRQFGNSRFRKSEKDAIDLDESNPDFLTFQLEIRRDDGNRMREAFPLDQKPGAASSESMEPSTTRLEMIEANLETSDLDIEEMENRLLHLLKTLAQGERIIKNNRKQRDETEGDEIFEKEHLSVEELPNSPSNTSQAEIQNYRRSKENMYEGPLDMLPWYLREQEEDTSLIPKVDIQQTRLEQYPALPINGPPLLQPLVSRLFYDHHLQNIVLLDLRYRDPPPAWGQNTIMILATGRNERQLVSVAETTSKWLRTTAGVEPRIDGLPRRESVLLKRRRLRRKALQKPGYLLSAPRPTSWVSMYTGYQGVVLQLFTQEGREEYDLEGLWGDKRVIDAGLLDMKPRKTGPGGLDDDEPIETSSKTRSQNKPQWLKKSEGKQRKWEMKKEKKAAKKRWTKQEREMTREQRMQGVSTVNISRNTRLPVQATATPLHFQQRRFHTSVPRFDRTEVASNEAVDSALGTHGNEQSDLGGYQRRLWRFKTTREFRASQKEAAWWGKSYDFLQTMTDTVLPSSSCEQLLDQLRDQSPFSPRDTGTQSLARLIAFQSGPGFARKLSNLCAADDPASLVLLAHFGTLSRFISTSRFVNDAETRLATYSVDPFPEKGFHWAFDFFQRDMPTRPDVNHWQLAVLFYLKLHMHSPNHYSIRRLLDVLLLPVSQGITISKSTLHLILNHIAISSPEHRDAHKEAEDSSLFLKNVNHRIQEIGFFVEVMKSRFGHDTIHDEEVYLAICKACCQPFQSLNEFIRDIDLPIPNHHIEGHLRRAIGDYFHENLRVSPEYFLLELLQFAHTGKWKSFLKRWGRTRSVGIGRDADMWTFFWACLARGQDEYHIRYALREYYNEMLDEGDYLVLNRNVATALVKCIDIVDPQELEFEQQRRVAKNILESIPAESQFRGNVISRVEN